MKKVLLGIAALLSLSVLAVTSSFAVESDDILGSWITEGGESCVEIFKKGELYFAKITALEQPNYEAGDEDGVEGTPRLDVKNPDESLRSRPALGLELMKNFRFTGKKWEKGKIYDPDNGKTYKCKMTLKDGGILNVRGFIGVSLLGRTTIWTRPETYVKQQGQPLTFQCPCEQ